jgi:hypothetical protein
MDSENMMPVDGDPALMWTLSPDCTDVRLALPPIALEGLLHRRDERLAIAKALDRKTVIRKFLCQGLPEVVVLFHK